MRSMKRPRRPVHRYQSLLFPGIAVLALFVFWAAVVPAEKGETVLFEKDGLRLEITGIQRVGDFLLNFDPDRHIQEPYDTYYLYPGSKVTVLEAPTMDGTDGTARWELRAVGREAPEPMGLVKEMDPLKFTEEGSFHIYDLKREITTVRFEVTEDGPDHWK